MGTSVKDSFGFRDKRNVFKGFIRCSFFKCFTNFISDRSGDNEKIRGFEVNKITKPGTY